MKSFLSIVLVALLFLPLWGTFGYLTLQKKQVQKSVKRQIMKGIDREELIFMAFSQEELQTKLNWKHAKEFELNGEMYDIVERNETVDSAFYWVWWDNDETELNQRVRNLTTALFGGNLSHHKSNLIVANFYHSLFFETNNFAFKASNTSESSAFFNYLLKPYDTYLEVDSPPPIKLI